MKKIVFIVLFLQICLFSHASLQEDITQARLALYQQSSSLDAARFKILYKQVQAIEDPDEKLWLFARLGILFCESYLYHSSAFPLVQVSELNQIYKDYRKEALKSTSAHVLRESGELSFYMMRLFPKKRLAYLMDARMFFLKSLSVDKKNLNTRLALGKWWVYRIMNIKNNEINHPLAQVDKYLSDENFDLLLKTENDSWQRINIANCLYLRSIIDRRALRIEQAEKHEQFAQSLLPASHLHAMLQKSHANTPTRWF